MEHLEEFGIKQPAKVRYAFGKVTKPNQTNQTHIGLVCLVLWHINLCGLFNAKSIFI